MIVRITDKAFLKYKFLNLSIGVSVSECGCGLFIIDNVSKPPSVLLYIPGADNHRIKYL